MAPERIPYTRNFFMLLGLECCWAFGWWLANPVTVLPNFLIRFGASPEVIGLIPAMWGIGLGLGALTVGSLASRHNNLARFLGYAHYVAMLPYAGLGLLALAAERMPIPDWAGQTACIVLLGAFHIVMGPLFQLYFVMISRVLPEHGRGRLLGFIFAVAASVGFLGPLLASTGFTGNEAPMSVYARIFFASFLVFAVGNTFFFLLKERPQKQLAPRTVRDNVAKLFHLWKRNVRLRKYLTSRMLLDGAVLTSAFLATYSRMEGGMNERTVMQLGSLVVLSQAAGSLVLGWITGRRREGSGRGPDSYVRAQWLARSAMMFCLFFAVLGPAKEAAFLLAVGAGLLASSEMVVHPNVLMEMGPRHHRADMMILGTVIFTPNTLLIPPLCGTAIRLIGHRPVFGLAVVIGLVGLVRMRRLFERREVPLENLRKPKAAG